MSYQAIVCRIRTRPHPNAEAIQLGTAAGHQVVIGLDVVAGTLGVFFPVDGQLSHEMAHHNNLYRAGKGDNVDPEAGGYLEASRRIRTLRLRGEKSEGLWLPIRSIEWAGNVAGLAEGDMVSEVAGQEVCRKYVTPATRRAINQSKAGRVDVPMFHRHYDTPQLRFILDRVTGQRCIVTEKVHGTSARTAHVRLPVELPAWKRAANWLAGKAGGQDVYPREAWGYISGTRRTVIAPGVPHADECRNSAHSMIRSVGLRKGETLFYELVGYMSDAGALIMGSHGVPKDSIGKAMRKRYGDVVQYTYGCEYGEHRILVYRITRTDVSGEPIELPWAEVVGRCAELGLHSVPVLYEGPAAQETLDRLTAGHSVLDDRHPREGVCARFEGPDTHGVWKYKGFEFCHLEGIRKNQDGYVDAEEAA